MKRLTLITADRSSQIQELRIAFLKKLRTFKCLQTVFMPGVEALRDAAEEAWDPERLPPKAEDIKLWLPSDLVETQQQGACARGVVEVEAKLRAAQCVDVLVALRSHLHTQKFLLTWRNSNSTGQRAATLIGQVGDRIRRVSGKYRQVRTAVIALKGAGFAPQFKELKDSDMNVNPEESDALSRKKLGCLGSSRQTWNEPTNAKKTFSWIWMVGGGPGEDKE